MSKARDLADSVSTGGILEDGAVSVSEISDLTVTAAELNNVAGVNSDVQTQLDLKAPLASPTFTGDATFDTDTLFVDSTNNRVGIGTNSPARSLQVESDSNRVVSVKHTDGSSAYVTFSDNATTNDGQVRIGAVGDDLVGIASSVEGMRLTSTGLGIGTSSPARKLQVESADSNRVVSVKHTAGAYSYVTFSDNTTTDDGTVRVGALGDDLLNFVGGAERLRITSNGEFGIGGANYGTAGQVLTSGGSGTAPTWADAAGGATITATADGAVSAGDAVALQTDGTIKAITETITTLGSPTVSNDRQIHGNSVNGYEHLYWFPTAGVYVYFAQFGSDGKIWVFPFDHSTNTRGSFIVNGQTVISGSISQDLSSAFDSTTGKFFLCWQFSGSVRYISGIVFSDGTIDTDANGEANFTTIRTSDNAQDVVVSETDNNFRMVYARSNGLYVKQFSVDSNGISTGVGGTQNLASTSASGLSAAWDSDNNRFMVAFRNDGSEDRGTAVYFTFSSAGSFTKHQETNFENTAYQNIQHTDIAYNPYYNRFVVFYDKQSAGSRVIPLTISGTSFSVGTSAQVTATHPQFTKQISYDPATNKTVCFYVNSGGAQFNVADVSSTTPSMAGAVSVDGTTSSSECAIIYNTTDRLFACLFHNGGAYMRSVTTSTASSNNTDWIGFASEAISNAASGDILVVGSTDENQTGLTIGSTYYVQSDGTLGTSTTNAIKAGRALSATKLLITEGNA